MNAVAAVIIIGQSDKFLLLLLVDLDGGSFIGNKVVLSLAAVTTSRVSVRRYRLYSQDGAALIPLMCR